MSIHSIRDVMFRIKDTTTMSIVFVPNILSFIESFTAICHSKSVYLYLVL